MNSEIQSLARLREINPDSIQWLKDNGIDLEKDEMIEIAPSAQHFQGGVKIRKQGDTEIKGLFAAGECAGGRMAPTARRECASGLPGFRENCR